MNDVVSTVKDEVVQDVAALNAYAMEHSPPITDAISSTIDTVSEKISNHVITPIFNPDEKEEGTGKETGCLEANCQKCSVM
ncbi:hypothetical protein AGDE_13682 [Angomonas deanei]|nr:hypothetical protein AGDE_13682 [Angomonas deanei]|eukprot:EPY21992.1 hypothetical protein AGDE_13682 [Angomonas deanei]